MAKGASPFESHIPAPRVRARGGGGERKPRCGGKVRSAVRLVKIVRRRPARHRDFFGSALRRGRVGREKPHRQRRLALLRRLVLILVSTLAFGHGWLCFPSVPFPALRKKGRRLRRRQTRMPPRLRTSLCRARRAWRCRWPRRACVKVAIWKNPAFFSLSFIIFHKKIIKVRQF